jgi:hypothetical protein
VESREGVMGTTKGLKKYIETPEKLWEHFQAFLEWVKSNPYKVEDYVGKDADFVIRNKQRPITFIGFQGYLAREGIISDLRSYEQNDNNSYTDYLPIIARIKAICQSDIVEGAAANVYNANIAARVAGLVDKREVEQKEPRVFNIK